MKIRSINKITCNEEVPFYDVINANPYNNFLIKTNSNFIVSHNCFADEVSFQPNQDVEKQKIKAKTLINTAAARMQSRFMKGNVNPTILCLASSKRTEQSFMETFIEGKKKNESKTTRVVDEPQWVIRTDKNSDKVFTVAVGNKYLDSEVLPLDISEEDKNYYRNRGYSLLDVPIGYYENFIDDIDIALTDIAGISTSNVTRYISGSRLALIKKPEMQNIFTKDIIEVGNGIEDTAQYYDFIDLNRLNRKLLDRPLFIHLDMSISGDKTGIAGVWIKGKKPHVEGSIESKELFYTLAFSVAIKAPKGHQISFEKNRQFIRWLRNQGFAIKGISADSFQSADLLQQLAAENFNTEIISVDKIDTASRICIPYQTFKSAIYEQRLEMYDSKLLTEEIIGLERDNNGKIDHGPSGINSKDTSDAVCGALFNASKHAEEFAFFWGEDLDNVVEVSSSNATLTQKQVSVDMEKELNKIFDPLQEKVIKKTKDDTSNFMDFGYGRATSKYSAFYLANGIIV